MYYLAKNLTTILSLFTLIGHIVLFGLLILFLFRKTKPLKKLANEVFLFLGEKGLVFAFLISLSAIAFSLFYSELAHFDPCKLCWIQRIFIYPQFILLLVAYYRKEEVISSYLLPLSVIGSMIGGYHYLTQISPAFQSATKDIVPCTVNGGPACSSYYFLEFGYITIPLMSFTAFVFSIIVLSCHIKYRKRQMK